MALILAIEPDKKQASTVRALARGSLHAQILIAESTARGVQELNGRIPDLILTSLLLSPKDEAALDEHLRGLDAGGHRVPTLVIPVLAAASRGAKSGGLLKRLKKPRKSTGTDACDPATFAAQITEYLDRAAAERELEEPGEDEDDELPIAARPSQAPEPVDEAPTPQAHVASMPVGRILFSSSDIRSMDMAPALSIPPEPLTPEAIDLNAFVEELEAVVSSYQPGGSGIGDRGSAIGDRGAGIGAGTVLVETVTLVSESIAPRVEPPAGAMTLYSWPVLEGLPAGTEWDIAEPGDPDYTVLADFIEAFETPMVDPAPSDIEDATEETPEADALPASPTKAVNRDSWIALSLRTRYNWPPLEGVESLNASAEIEAADAVLDVEIADAAILPRAQAKAIVVEAAAVPPAPPAQWLEILAAIRRDIQELRTEHRHDPPIEGSPADALRNVEASKARRPQAASPPPPRPAKRKRKPPKQDEWGFFDPDQCGFAALLAKLEEIESDDPPPTPERS